PNPHPCGAVVSIGAVRPPAARTMVARTFAPFRRDSETLMRPARERLGGVGDPPVEFRVLRQVRPLPGEPQDGPDGLRPAEQPVYGFRRHLFHFTRLRVDQLGEKPLSILQRRITPIIRRFQSRAECIRPGLSVLAFQSSTQSPIASDRVVSILPRASTAGPIRFNRHDRRALPALLVI